MDTAPPTPRDLSALRAEIDQLDDALHDLLMRRAAVVGEVAALGPSKVPFRPGREAAVIRRLLSRHAGALPRRALPRLWRELFAATTAMQSRFSVVVSEADGADPLARLAREHFGALTPLRVLRSPAQAMGDVRAGRATVAVLPLPVEDEPAHAAWWTALLHQDEPRLHVVARLPFWAAQRPDGMNAAALVVGSHAPDPSGEDRALVGLELPAEMSRARFTAALAGAGLADAGLLLRRDPGGGVSRALIDIALSPPDEDRLASLAQAVLPPIVLGGYALPISEGAE